MAELIAHKSNMMVVESLHELGPRYMSDLFIRISQRADRGLRTTAADLRVPKRKSTVGQTSVSYGSTKVWNSLSTECKEMLSLRNFKYL